MAREPITADTLSEEMLLRLRERAIADENAEVVNACDVALGTIRYSDIGRVQAIHRARSFCAALLNARKALADLNNRGFRICERVPKADSSYLDGSAAEEWMPIDDKRAIRVLEMLLLSAVHQLGTRKAAP